MDSFHPQVMCKLKARINPQSHNKQIQYIRVTFAIIMGLFLAMNLSSAILSRVYPNSVALIRVRVCLSGLLFIVAGGFLAYLIWKLSRMSFVGSVLLESRVSQNFGKDIFVDKQQYCNPELEVRVQFRHNFVD